MSNYDEALILNQNKRSAFNYIFVYLQFLQRNFEKNADVTNFNNIVRSEMVKLGYDFGPLMEHEEKTNVISFQEEQRKRLAKMEII